MVCSQCNSVLPERAAFCHVCGAKQSAEAMQSKTGVERCTIQFVEVESKWSLFGKEICEFRACRENGEVVMASEQMTLSGFEYNGPNEKNKKHKRAFDKLVVQMLQQGWQQAPDEPQLWYAISFWR